MLFDTRENVALAGPNSKIMELVETVTKTLAV